jgi:hypothetical protein
MRMAQCDENSEPKERSAKKGPHTDRLRFMADRMALLMVELVRRDFDFGRFCFEEFYVGEVPDHLRKSKDYETCMEFVRMMLRRHDAEQREKTDGK